MLEVRRFIYEVLTVLDLCSVAHWKEDVLPLETYPQDRQHQVLRHFLRTVIGFFEIRKGLQHQNRQMFFDKWYETANVFKTYEFPKKPSCSVNFLINFFQIGELKDAIDPDDQLRCIWAGRSIHGWQEYRANARVLNSVRPLAKLVKEKKNDMRNVFKILLDLQKLESGSLAAHWEKLRYTTQTCWVLSILLSPYDLIKPFEKENFLQVPSWNVARKRDDFMSIVNGGEKIWCNPLYKSPIHVDYHKETYEHWLINDGDVDVVMLLELFVFFYSVAKTLKSEEFAQTLEIYVHRYEKATQYMENERYFRSIMNRNQMTELNALVYQHVTDCQDFTDEDLEVVNEKKIDVFGLFPVLRDKTKKLKLELQIAGNNEKIKVIVDAMKERRSEIVKHLHTYWTEKHVGSMQLGEAIKMSVGERWRPNR